MNDYKELIVKLRQSAQGRKHFCINRGTNVTPNYIRFMFEAADAIEQLGRDNDVLTKERNAAVADLREAVMNPHIGRCEFCKYRDFKSPRCGNTKCRHGVLFSKAPDWDWQWRGVQEANNGT